MKGQGNRMGKLKLHFDCVDGKLETHTETVNPTSAELALTIAHLEIQKQILVNYPTLTPKRV